MEEPWRHAWGEESESRTTHQKKIVTQFPERLLKINFKSKTFVV
jgi:hypothetical protein